MNINTTGKQLTIRLTKAETRRLVEAAQILRRARGVITGEEDLAKMVGTTAADLDVLSRLWGGHHLNDDGTIVVKQPAKDEVKEEATSTELVPVAEAAADESGVPFEPTGERGGAS